MGGLSIWHLILLAAIAVVLFGGRGKISDLMGDFGKGVMSFRKGLAEENLSAPPAQLTDENHGTGASTKADRATRP